MRDECIEAKAEHEDEKIPERHSIRGVTHL